ncbi:hypothetical protein GF366_04090 [Candidatus Peregrinibacteria bacterium]|nr:hypothetical protein [Candidatus Peregrinibacteria bacterium]
MNDVVKAFVDKVEAKFGKAIAELKEKNADVRIEAEKVDLKNMIDEIKEKGYEASEETREKLQEKWDEFEAKYNELSG